MSTLVSRMARSAGALGSVIAPPRGHPLLTGPGPKSGAAHGNEPVPWRRSVSQHARALSVHDALTPTTVEGPNDDKALRGCCCRPTRRNASVKRASLGVLLQTTCVYVA